MQTNPLNTNSFLYFRYADSFSSQLWQRIRATQNTRLQRLVTAMPEYLLHAKAPTTVRKYISEWQRWKSWELVHFGAHTFPVSVELISIYLFDWDSSTRSLNALSSTMYGIRWAHNIAGLQSSTDNIIVQQIVEATKRLYAKSPSPRKPITVDTLYPRSYQNTGAPVRRYPIFAFVLFFL